MATNTLDQALANLRTGGLQGTTLQMAEQSLRNSYGIAPVVPQGNPTLPAPVTAGSVYQPFNVPGPSDDDLLYDSLFERQKRQLKDVPNERDIYRQKLALYQKEINANNQIYADMLQKAQQRGIGDFGSQRAIQARSGLLGSDFAASQNSGVANANANRENLVRTEQAAALGAIMGRVRQDVAQELAAKRQAYDEGLAATRQFLAERATRRQNYASGLARQMLDSNLKFEEIDPNQLNTIAKQYGLSTADLLTAYKNEEASRAEALRQQRFTEAKEELRYNPDTGEYESTATPEGFELGEGQQRYEWNPETGDYELIAEGPEKQTGRDSFTAYQQFQATQNLANKAQKTGEAARELSRQANIINQTWNRYASGEAKDLNATTQAIVTTFNKILDPTSVVRESEYDRTGAGQALLDNIQGKIARISQGGAGLTPTSLYELVALANQYVQGAQTHIDSVNRRVREEAEFWGLPSDYVTNPGWEDSSSTFIGDDGQEYYFVD